MSRRFPRRSVLKAGAAALTAGPLLASSLVAPNRSVSAADNDADAVDVRDYGALGDGTADDTTAIRNTISAAAGARVIFPKPSSFYRITGALAVPSNCVVEGVGGQVEIRVDAGASHRVFDLDGVSNVVIKGFNGTKASGANLSGNAHFVAIRGDSSDVLVENVIADGFVRGVNVAGGEGTSSGTCRRITLRNVTANNSPTNFGINVDDTDTITVDNCYGRGNWLDGVKLRKNTKNVTVIGGAFTENGASGSGDGADCYAGGDTFVINGTVFDSNTGSGLTVKTGDLTQSDAANYGYVRNVQLIGLRCRNNTGIGCYITVSDPLDLSEPLVSEVTVLGGQFEGNGSAGPLDGLYIAARNVTVIGANARKNHRHGITVAHRSIDVQLIGCRVVANSQAAAGSFHGMSLDGTRIRVLGGTGIGADADTVAVDGDYNALTKYHSNNIRVSANASDVLIRDFSGTYQAASQSIRTDMTSGVCVIHQQGSGTPFSAGAYGSLGSTWTRTDTGHVWVKTSDNPNAPTTGWQLAQPKKLSASIGTTQTTVAHGLGYMPTDVWVVPNGAAYVWRSAASDGTNVYLTASSTVTCDIYAK